jgi:23S rRNA pseudouridine1911/1915/1917 synthase
MPAPRPNARIRVHIAHADERTIVANKMPGIVTEPGRSHRDDSLLNGLFAAEGGRFAQQLAQLGEARDWGLLHRLDRLTSGLVLVARDPNAYDALRADFEERWVRKTYLAIVRGHISDDAGEVDAPLSERIERDYRVSVPDPRGKPSLTRYRVLERAGRYALVECDLVTGRLHQIRVHLALVGAVVAGEPIYELGGRAKPNAGRAKDPQLQLHAWKLGYRAPPGAEATVGAGSRPLVSVTGEIPHRFSEFAQAHELRLPNVT